MICRARVDEAAKLIYTETFGWAFSNAAAISVKAPCSDAAAEMERFPEIPGVTVLLGLFPGLVRQPAMAPKPIASAVHTRSCRMTSRRIKNLGTRQR